LGKKGVKLCVYNVVNRVKTTDLLQLVSGGGDRKDPVPYGERSGWGKKIQKQV